MKRLLLSILVVGSVLLASILLVGCTTPSEPQPFPPPEGYESWEEYQRQTDSPQPTPSQDIEAKTEVEPETSIEVEPLEYEVQSYVKRVHHDTRFILGSVGFSKDPDEISKALQSAYSLPEYYPVGHVSVRNTDKIRGTFKVEIVFHYDDKEDRETFKLKLEPGEIGEVEKPAKIHYDNDEWSFRYEVIPDTKPVEK